MSDSIVFLVGQSEFTRAYVLGNFEFDLMQKIDNKISLQLTYINIILEGVNCILLRF